MNSWPLERLAKTYGLQIGNVKSKNKILYIESDIGPLAVKRSTLTSGELTFQISILDHLTKNRGYSHIAKIVPTKCGQGFAEIDEKKYLLTTWVKGVHPNFNNPYYLALGARALATFHKHAMGYQQSVPWPNRKLFGVWPMRFSYRLRHIQWYRQCISARGIRDEFDQLFMEHADHYLEEGYKVVELLRNPAYYALSSEARKLGTICHHDVAFHNILIDLAENAWLIDFDYCLLDIQVHDLANMISRHVKYTKWSLDDVARILLMYHQEKPLLPAELDALNCLMQFPQDFWQVAWARYNEVCMHKPETLLLRLKKVIAIENDRQQFLAEFSHLVRSKNFYPGGTPCENWY